MNRLTVKQTFFQYFTVKQLTVESPYVKNQKSTPMLVLEITFKETVLNQ